MDGILELAFHPATFYLAPLAVLLMALSGTAQRPATIRVTASFLLTAGAFLCASGVSFYLSRVARDGMGLVALTAGGSGLVGRWAEHVWPVALFGVSLILIGVVVTAYGTDRRRPGA